MVDLAGMFDFDGGKLCMVLKNVEKCWLFSVSHVASHHHWMWYNFFECEIRIKIGQREVLNDVVLMCIHCYLEWLYDFGRSSLVSDCIITLITLITLTSQQSTVNSHCWDTKSASAITFSDSSFRSWSDIEQHWWMLCKCISDAIWNVTWSCHIVIPSQPTFSYHFVGNVWF
jgi:hypothetical protein